MEQDNKFLELEEIYKDIAKRVGPNNPRCSMCGTCCNFDQNGMRLYIFHIERLYIQEKYKKLKLECGKCSGQKDNMCNIHTIRPLGCRTQFCSKTFEEVYEYGRQKILALEKKYNIEYDYGDAFED